ncbi:MAG: LysR family transcriptional regulator [Rhodospirillales bacterium]
MELRPLRTLVAIADFGSFAAAADSLGLTQSAVSLQIKALEAQRGVALFDRAHRPPQLTDLGRQLVVEARHILGLYDRLFERGDGAVVGELALGAVPTALGSIMPPALAALRAQHPDLSIRVTSGLSGELAGLLRSGTLDAALVSEPQHLAEGLLARPVHQDPLMVIAPPDTPGSSDRDLLRANPFIQFSRRAWAGERIDRALRERGIAVTPSMEIDSLEAIVAMVRHRLGVSIVPLPFGRRPEDLGLRGLPFGRPPMMRALVLLERAESPKALLILTLRRALAMIVTGHATLA